MEVLEGNLSDNIAILQEFWSELEGNLSDDVAILQKFQSEFWPGNAAVYFLIKIPMRSRFVISMSADSMCF